MSNDTNDSKNICKPSSINHCPHYHYVDPNKRELDKQKEFIQVGVRMPPQYVFHIQRIADEQFPKYDTDKPHLGNKAKVIYKLLEYGIDRYNSVKKRGTFREIMEGKYDDEGSLKKEKLSEQIENLEENNQKLKEKLDEKTKELKQVKKENAIVNDNSDIVIHILDVISAEPLTLDQIFHKLKDEKGLEFRKYEHPMDSETSIGLKGLIDFFLQNLIDRNQVEVSRENGRTVYEA